MAALDEARVLNLTAEFMAKYEEKVDQELADIKDNIDAFFLIVMSIIIYFMQCGFAFVETGAVRSKNATNILIKNLLDSFIAAVSYWVIGYPLAFGEGNFFLGTTFWAHHNLPDSQLPYWFFQYVFAATAATIVSGAVAERCEFISYIVYSCIITGFIYPVVTHWAWSSDGWLGAGQTYNIGVNGSEVTVAYQDFAGSGVVHLVGGSAAIIGAVFLGPRKGRFGDDGEELRGHSVPLAALGGFILLFGFFAFNGGSQGAISSPGDGIVVAKACVNTIISGSFAAFMGLIMNRIIGGCVYGDAKWSLLTTVNASLCGMVAICAGCNVLDTWAAAVVGLVAGITYICWSALLPYLKIDDPLDAFAVHAGGGIWGLIAVALLQAETGIFFTFSKESFLKLGWQFAGIAAIMAWTIILCAIMFGLLKAFKLLRVDPEIEMKGLDIPKHGEPAYPIVAYGHGWGERGDTLNDMVKLSSQASLVAVDKNSQSITKQIKSKSAEPKFGENSELDAQRKMGRSISKEGKSNNGFARHSSDLEASNTQL